MIPTSVDFGSDANVMQPWQQQTVGMSQTVTSQEFGATVGEVVVDFAQLSYQSGWCVGNSFYEETEFGEQIACGSQRLLVSSPKRRVRWHSVRVRCLVGEKYDR